MSSAHFLSFDQSTALVHFPNLKIYLTALHLIKTVKFDQSSMLQNTLGFSQLFSISTTPWFLRTETCFTAQCISNHTSLRGARLGGTLTAAVAAFFTTLRCSLVFAPRFWAVPEWRSLDRGHKKASACQRKRLRKHFLWYALAFLSSMSHNAPTISHGHGKG